MNNNFMDWYGLREKKSSLIIGKMVDNIEEYKNKKYDYIYLNGTLENADKIINTYNSYEELIMFFKGLLSENGKLFIAVNNKYGVRYLAGNKSEHCEKIYDSLNNKFCNGKLFSKVELDEIIQKVEFNNKRYYYPLPNYEKPNIIFTDDKLPDRNNSKLNYNVIYEEGSLVVQDEIELLKLFIEQKKFKEFTNSYIVQLSDGDIKEDVKYYGFNNMRKDKYSLILKMKDDYVEKFPKTKEAVEHINEINKNSKRLQELGFDIAEEDEENIVKSRYIKLKLLDEYLIENVENKEKVYELINDWYEYIKEKLQTDEEGIVKEGFIDLVFENTFYDNINNKYIFFDQEWSKKDVPIKFILYRAIHNLYKHNPNIEKNIKEQEMLDRCNVSEDIEKFRKMELEIQTEIIDKEKQKFYAKQYEYKISLEEVKKIMNDVKKLDKDNVELIGEIRRLEEKTKMQDDIINEKNKIILEYRNKNLIEKIKQRFLKKG